MKKETLCWECKNANCGCSWSQEFKPVKDWKAKATIVKDFNGNYESFHVIKCPEFEKEEKKAREKHITIAKIAKILGMRERTAYRRSKEDLIKQLAEHGIKAKYEKDGARGRFYEIS